MNSSPDYIKGLDGIRGLAMATVVLTHMRLVGIGWITIQVFYVLSGFLITRILLGMREKHPLAHYLKVFYARRTLRIFPIYYLFLFILLLLTFVVDGMERQREQIPYALLYVWNWFAVTDQAELTKYLEHFWSLAVEEQFYLCWPLLVFFARGSAFWKIALGIAIAGPLIRYATVMIWPYLDGVSPNIYGSLYQLSTTHLDAFAVGALLCFWVRHPASLRFKPAHLAVAVVIAYLLGAMSSGLGIAKGGPYMIPFNLGYPAHMASNYQYTWGYTVINLVSAGLILLVAQGRLWPAVFQNKLIQRMGVVSYSAYIFHLALLYLLLPLIKLVQEAVGSVYWGTWLCAPFFLLLLFTLSEISYRYFESRFLLMKDSMFKTAPASAGIPSLPAAPHSQNT